MNRPRRVLPLLLGCTLLLLLPGLRARAGDAPGDAPPAREDAREDARPGAEPLRHAMRVLEYLRDHEPERHRQLLELRQTDREAFRRELQRIGRELHRGGALQPPERAHDGLGPPEDKLGRRLLERGLHERFMKQLQASDPDTYARLDKLRRGDHEAFRRELREVFAAKVENFRERAGHQRQEVQELVERVRAAEDDQTRQAARQALYDELAEGFDEQLRLHEEAIDRLAEQLEDAQRKLSERRAARQEIIERRLDLLLDGGELPAPETDRPRRPRQR